MKYFQPKPGEVRVTFEADGLFRIAGDLRIRDPRGLARYPTMPILARPEDVGTFRRILGVGTDHRPIPSRLFRRAYRAGASMKPFRRRTWRAVGGR